MSVVKTSGMKRKREAPRSKSVNQKNELVNDVKAKPFPRVVDIDEVAKTHFKSLQGTSLIGVLEHVTKGVDLCTSRLLAFCNISELVTHVQGQVESLNKTDNKVCVENLISEWLGFEVYGQDSDAVKLWQLEYSLYAIDDESGLKTIIDSLQKTFSPSSSSS
jgi:hypothetical protein